MPKRLNEDRRLFIIEDGCIKATRTYEFITEYDEECFARQVASRAHVTDGQVHIKDLYHNMIRQFKL